MNNGGADEDFDVVAIMDAGAQYGKLIDRRVQQLSVKSEIIPLDTPVEELQRRNYKALIISGGPGSVIDDTRQMCDPKLLEVGIPILGICYGMHLIVSLSGGEIRKMEHNQDGLVLMDIVGTSSPLFEGIFSQLNVLLTHANGYFSDRSLNGLDILATLHSNKELVLAIGDDQRKIYAVQFHPETQLTSYGMDMFQNFLLSIAGCRQNYTVKSRLFSCVANIRSKLEGGRKALVLLSGGVDSAVCAALLVKTVGPENVYCLHVDTGFTRLAESNYVCENMPKLIYGDTEQYSDHFKFVIADLEFFDAQSKTNGLALRDVKNPEEKREIIGDTFVRVVKRQIRKMFGEEGCVLVQGTLRPDLIESASHLASSSACCIKTHHNDTELVREMRSKGLVLEPLKDFHKDEVREIARTLNLPEKVVNRHPFPGPGLAVRILCVDPRDAKSWDDEYQQSTKALCELMCDCSHIPESEEMKQYLSTYNLEYAVLPVKSVGVSGDCRTYKFPIAIHCPDANFKNIPSFWEDMCRIGQLLINYVPNVNRAVYSFRTPEHLAVRQKSRLTSATVNLLRTCDDQVTRTMGDNMSRISQMPVILLPLSYLRVSKRAPFAVVLRPIVTDDFMTALAALPGTRIDFDALESCVDALHCLVEVVLYDLTSKPPGTTEWE